MVDSVLQNQISELCNHDSNIGHIRNTLENRLLVIPLFLRPEEIIKKIKEEVWENVGR